MNIVSLSPGAQSWLAKTSQAHVLHVFDSACNLINEDGDVLSIVTPNIGNGPLNLVCLRELCFSKYLTVESAISIFPAEMRLGDLRLSTSHARLWRPHPDWKYLHAQREKIAARFAELPLAELNIPNPLSTFLAGAAVQASVQRVLQLAGLGPGLTPAGDDFIVGSLYAVWMVHPFVVAQTLARDVASTAAQLTTSLSAAYLRSAGSGEAGISWHRFFSALISCDSDRIYNSILEVLSMGASSGSDALSGFVSTFISHMELQRTACHS
jgi:hypothetical protein